MCPSVLALALWGLAAPGRADPPPRPQAPAQEDRFDDAHPPSESLLRTYVSEQSRGVLPPDQVSALEDYLSRKETQRASALELEARFVKQPPSEETLAQFLRPNPRVPQNLSDAVWTYLYNKPMDRMSATELQIEIRSQEAAKAKSRSPVYDDGLRRLRAALAAKQPAAAAPGAAGSVPPKKAAPPSLAAPDQGPASRPATAAPETAAAGAINGAGGGSASLAGLAEQARRGADAAGDGDAAGVGAAAQRGRNAAARAGALGEKLKAGLPDGSPELLKGAGPGPAGTRAAGGPDLDLTAAAASGFGASFSAAGLKLAGGRIVRLDGSPAAEADIARLRAQIASDPQALLRRPDFFSVISREKFARLKADFAGKPQARDAAFRHVALTENGRDFARTRSCSKNLETGCSPLARASYKKGEYLSPEELNDISAALHPEDGEARVAADAAPRSAESASLARSIAGRLDAMVKDLAGRVRGAASGEGLAAGFAAERDAGAVKTAARAIELLKRVPGDEAAALLRRLEAAAALKDPAQRAERLRAALGEADRSFERLLARRVLERLAAGRAAACKGKAKSALAKCLDRDFTAPELEAARADAFTADPDLGLYFVERGKHQLLMKTMLAEGRLEPGLRLEPWEIGESRRPAGTTIVAAAEPATDQDGAYAGLRYAFPDGSALFEGSRAVKDGAERLVDARKPGGGRQRIAVVVKPGKKEGTEIIVRSDNVLFDAGGGRIRAVKMRGPGGPGTKLEIKDFNPGAVTDGDYWRFESVETDRNKRTRRTMQDFNAGYEMETGFDGAFAMKARKDRGLPMNPKDAGAGPDKRWVSKKGRVVDGKLALSELTLADGTVMTGAADSSGRFSPTRLARDGMVMTGRTDGAGNFAPETILGPDGRGTRARGYAIKYIEMKGKTEVALGYSVDLGPVAKEKGARSAVIALRMAQDLGALAGYGAERAVPLANFIFDQYWRYYNEKGKDLDWEDVPNKDFDLWVDDGEGRASLCVGPDGESMVALKGGSRLECTPAGFKGADQRTSASWSKANRAYPGSENTPALVGTEPKLGASGNEGLPYREYLSDGHRRQWIESTEAKDNRVCTQLYLVDQKRANGDHGKWACAKPGGRACSSRAALGDCDTLCLKKKADGRHCETWAKYPTAGEIFGGLAEDIGGLPVIKQVGSVGKGAFYITAGGIQQLAQLTPADGPNLRLATISNMWRSGAFSKSDTLARIDADPDLREGVNEKVLETRWKERGHDCIRLGDDECRRSLNGPPVTDDERMRVVDYAYSSGHAIDVGVKDGNPALLALGVAAQLGESSAAALPLMGLTSGLGAVGELKAVGGMAKIGTSASAVANVALTGLLTTGWVAGGTSNGFEFGAAVKSGDYAKMVKTGFQMGTDLFFAYEMASGPAGAGRKKAAVEKSLAGEGARLTKLKFDKGAGLTWERVDLSKAKPEQIALYEKALAELDIAPAPAEHGIVELEMTPNQRAALGEKLQGSGLELLDLSEMQKRRDERASFTGDEVDAMFAKESYLNDAIKLDLAEYPPKDYKVLREAAKELGGKWAEPVDGVAEVSLPHGKAPEFLKRLEGTKAKVVAVEDSARSAREGAATAEAETAGLTVAEAKEIESLWQVKNGAELTRPETVAAQRSEAFAAAADPKLAAAVRAAEAAREIAPASWQGRQGAEGNCVPHALANASDGAFTLAETVSAGKAAGADYAAGGTSEPQLLQMMVALEQGAAAKGVEIDYRALEPRDYLQTQEAAAKAGAPRQAAVAVIRTGGSGADVHGLHAVALRGQIIVDGRHYIVVTDSHLNSPLLYTPEAFSAAVVSNGVVLIDVVPAKGGATPAAGPVPRGRRAAEAEPAGAGEPKPKEAEPTKEGDGGHGEHGSVEERRRQGGQWEYYRVDQHGRVTPVIDGNIDLVNGAVLARRHKKTGAVEVDGQPRYSTIPKVEEAIRRRAAAKKP